MNIGKFGRSVADFGKKIIFNTKKHSPIIMTGGAILLGVGTVVATWFAARKTDDALKEAKEVIKAAKDMEIDEHYTKENQRHDIFLGYRKGAVQIIKLYGPAVLMGAGSIACCLASHKILSNRNAGLIAANSVLTKDFGNYRQKVIEKFGKDTDKELHLASLTDEVEETVKDENGEEKTIKKKVPKKEYIGNTFGRFFDEWNPNWTKDPSYNLMFLNLKMSELNDMLAKNYVVLLNDVYEALDMEKTQAGWQYGWVRHKGEGDDMKEYIDFGIHNMSDKQTRNFLLGYERSVFLDFNCSKIVWSETPFKEA